MPKLFSITNKKVIKQTNKSEKELNSFLVENWQYIFTHLTFIKSEFILNGNARSNDSKGRIDILAFNPKTKKFVIFELKKDFDKNISQQANDYKDFVEDNFEKIYLESSQKYKADLPSFYEIDKENIEIFFIAKTFSQAHLNSTKKRNNVTLIRYFWFEDNLFLIDYVNNDPEQEESKNGEKIKKIKNIIDGKENLSQTDLFFHNYQKSKELFDKFYKFLENFGNIEQKIKMRCMSLEVNNHKFSVIPKNGGSKWKSFLQINTDFNVNETNGLIFDDRKSSKYLKNGKKKGSLGNERFEVFLQNNNQLNIFIEFLKHKL